jgi:peptidyl-tRNA hydrolase
MEDHNSPEDVAKRANQEDPIVMYLVVRESLNMTAGKVGAQCGHAAQIALLQYFRVASTYFGDVMNYLDGAKVPPRLAIFKEWLDNSFRKVTLKADDKEWKKVQLEFVENATRFTVIDAGLTEIPAGSETVMAIWPMRKSQRPKILQKLQALK